MGIEVADIRHTHPTYQKLTAEERKALVQRVLAQPTMVELAKLSKQRGERIFWRSVSVLVILIFGLVFVPSGGEFSSTLYYASVFGIAGIWVGCELWLWLRWWRREAFCRVQPLFEVELDHLTKSDS